MMRPYMRPNKMKRLLKKISFIVIGLFLLELFLQAGGFIYVNKRNQENLSENDGEIRILCLGESTTAEGGMYSWPSQLETLLNQNRSEIKFKVINRGKDGTNTAFILSELESNLNKYTPDITVTMMGFNDSIDQLNMQYNYSFPKSVLENIRLYKLIRLLVKNLRLQAGPFLGSNEIEGNAIDQKEPKADRPVHGSKVRPEESMNLDPDYQNYMHLGYFYQNNHMFEEAADMFHKALKINPDSELIFIHLGQIHRYTHNFEEAEKMYKRALEINPRERHIYIELSRYYTDQRKIKETERILIRAIQALPNDEKFYIELGNHYFYTFQYEKAAEAYERTLEINPLNYHAYNRLGLSYSHMNIPTNELERFYEKKGHSFRKINDIDPKDITLHHYNILYEKLRRRGVKLIAMQYPLTEVEELKNMFKGDEEIIFVGNEEIFSEALDSANYDEYFIDRCYGYFGHASPKGNQLIAANVASAILNELLDTEP